MLKEKLLPPSDVEILNTRHTFQYWFLISRFTTKLTARFHNAPGSPRALPQFPYAKARALGWPIWASSHQVHLMLHGPAPSACRPTCEENNVVSVSLSRFSKIHLAGHGWTWGWVKTDKSLCAHVRMLRRIASFLVLSISNNWEVRRNPRVFKLPARKVASSNFSYATTTFYATLH